MTCAPAASAMPIIRPSTCAGTPEIMCRGGVPSRAGHAARTRSWLPPMPPEETMTAWACSSKSPVGVRVLACPQPVLPGELDGVLDPQPPLLRGVDQEQAAKGPPGLHADRPP